jgi:hypothetical protein
LELDGYLSVKYDLDRLLIVLTKIKCVNPFTLLRKTLSRDYIITLFSQLDREYYHLIGSALSQNVLDGPEPTPTPGKPLAKKKARVKN